MLVIPIFFFANSPMTIRLVLSLMVCFTCLARYFLRQVIYGYILRLVVLRGLCILFYYVSCLSDYSDSELKITSGFLFIFFFMIFIYLFSYNFYTGFTSFSSDLNYVYNYSYGLLGIFIICYLYFSLIVVVNINKTNRKPISNL